VVRPAVSDPFSKQDQTKTCKWRSCGRLLECPSPFDDVAGAVNSGTQVVDRLACACGVERWKVKTLQDRPSLRWRAVVIAARHPEARKPACPAVSGQRVTRWVTGTEKRSWAFSPRSVSSPVASSLGAVKTTISSAERRRRRRGSGGGSAPPDPRSSSTRVGRGSRGWCRRGSRRRPG